jgi:WD40 repeat protein
MLAVPCPACQRVLRASAHLFGDEVRCPRCDHAWRLPDAPARDGRAGSEGILTAPAVIAVRETPSETPGGLSGPLTPETPVRAPVGWLRLARWAALILVVLFAFVAFATVRWSTPKIWICGTPGPSSGWTGILNTVQYSPDGKTIVTACADDVVKLWDAQTGEQLATLAGHAGRVDSAAYSPDGTRIASCGWDRRIKLWDAWTGDEIATLAEPGRWVDTVVYCPDGKTLATTDNTNITLWDIETGQTRSWDSGHRGCEQHTSFPRALAFNPDGHILASASAYTTIKLWDVLTGEELATLQGHTDKVFGVSFSPDGKLLASSSDDGTVRLWNVETGQERTVLTGHERHVHGVVFSPDGKLVASASWDKTVKLWDVATGEEIATFLGHTGWVCAVAFRPDGKQLASAGTDGVLRLWDLSAYTE